MNPSATYLYGSIKLHKQDKPIRPTVNWENSPSYKIAKYLNKILQDALHLPYTFYVKNTTALMQGLSQMKTGENTRLCSFDIENMYTNIPTNEVRNTINEILNRNNVKEEVKEEILDLLNVILEQNDIQINEKYYLKNEGLAMWAPTSAMLSEVYIHNLQHTSIADSLSKHQIIYYRHVDDILVVYDEQITNIINMIEHFNAIHPKLKFTVEQQTQNRINYVDLTIKKYKN
jgi:hypothetical protein